MQSPNEQISEESKKFLLEAKKGKPRKFVIVKDGVQIDRLIVFKTGSFDRVIRTAKQDGAFGEMYFGMLQGDGLDIRFELSRADGFSSPPGTEARLKEFLREAAGLKFEPVYVIVDKSAPGDEIAEDNEDDDATESQTTESVTASGDTSVVEKQNEDKFVRFLKSILPHVKRALATQTSVSSELQQSVREAQDLGRKREFEQGLAALQKVGALTKQSLAEAEAAKSAADANDIAAPSKTAPPTRRQQWETRLSEIEPGFRAALLGSSENVSKLQKVMSYAQNEARRQQFVKALTALDRIERLLKASVNA